MKEKTLSVFGYLFYNIPRLRYTAFYFYNDARLEAEFQLGELYSIFLEDVLMDENSCSFVIHIPDCFGNVYSIYNIPLLSHISFYLDTYDRLEAELWMW